MNLKKFFSLICLSVCFLSAFAQEIDIESLYRSSGLPTGNALLAAGPATGTVKTTADLQSDAFWTNTMNWSISTSGEKGNPWLLPAGSKALPYQRTGQFTFAPSAEISVGTKAELKALLGAYRPHKVKLTGNIDFEGDTINTLFEIGSFDGQGYTISNFVLQKHPSFGEYGFFYRVDSVLNLTLAIKEFTHPGTTSRVGILVSHLPSGSVLRNCHVKPYLSSSITVTGVDSVGGLVGVSEGTIDGCSVEGINVKATNHYAGGLVGYCYASSAIDNCKVREINVTATGNNVGGVTGANSGSCKNSDVSRATLTAIQKIGGITGEHASTGELSGNTVDSTTIVATGGGSGHYLGGIVGYGLANSFTLSNCKVDSVSLTSGGNNIGGIIGTSKANISLCSASRIVISGQSYLGGLAGASDAVGTINSSTVTNSKIAGTYNPTLAGGLVGDNNGAISSCKVDGATVTGPNTIGGLVGRISTECTLTADTVINSKIKASDNYAGGLVGCEYKYETTIIKVAVNNCVTRLDSVWGKNCVGGFVGRLHGSVSGGSADSMYIEASGGTHSWAGGIAGSVELPTTTISGVSAKNNFVKADGPYAGGITGWTKGAVSYCKVDNATVRGPNYIGGLVGYIAAACTLTTDTVINSKIKASSNYAGGLVGGEDKDNNIKVTVFNCVARMDSVSGNYCVGGFVGRLLGSVSGGYADSMYISAIATGDSWAGGIAGSGESGSDIKDVYAKHIFVTATGDNAGGIVGTTLGAVTSCKVDSSSIIGKSIVGGLVGFGKDTNTKVTRCTVDSVRVTANSHVGGLLGFNLGEIDSCSAFRAVVSVGNISGQQVAGGLVGSNTGTVKNSKTEFATVGGYTLIGGLIGNNTGELRSNIVSNAKVTSNNSAGGLVGQNTANILYSKVDSTTVNGINYIGGLVGYISGACTLTSDTVINSKITASSNHAGGLVGCDLSTGKVTVSDCVTRLDSVSGASYVGGFVGDLCGSVIGGSADSMYIFGTSTGNNYVGGIVGVGEVPSATTTSGVSAKHISVTALGAYAGGIAGLHRGTVSSCKIDSSSVRGISYVGGVVGKSDGTSANITSCFVDSVNVYGSSGNIGGIVGLNQGTVTSDTVNNSIIVCNANNVGGIVGYNTSGTVQNSIVLGSKITLNGTVRDNGCGGIVGYNFKGTVTKSLFSGGKVTATGPTEVGCGGIVGYSEGGIISQSLVKDDSINGQYLIGGVVGRVNNYVVDINNCHVHNSDIYSSATSGETYQGGIVGILYGTVTNCLVTNAVIRNYNTNITDVRLGGIVGGTAGSSTVTKNIAMVDYFDIRAKFPKNGNFGRIYGTTPSSSSGNLGWVETYIKYYHKKFGLYWEDDLYRSTGNCQNTGKNGNNLYVGDFYPDALPYRSKETGATANPWGYADFSGDYWDWTNVSALKFGTLKIFSGDSYTPLVANRGNEYTLKILADSVSGTYPNQIIRANNVKIFSPSIFVKGYLNSYILYTDTATSINLYTDILLESATGDGSGMTFWATDRNDGQTGNTWAFLFYYTGHSAFEFNGNGYSIDGYYNPYIDYVYAGHNSLFYLPDATTVSVKRLEVANFHRYFPKPDNPDQKIFGTILDKVDYSSTFEDIYIKNPKIDIDDSPTSPFNHLGGLVGQITNGTVNFTRVAAYMSLGNTLYTKYNGYLGGIVGYVGGGSVNLNNVATYLSGSFYNSTTSYSSSKGFYIGYSVPSITPTSSWCGGGYILTYFVTPNSVPNETTGSTGTFYQALAGASITNGTVWHIPTTTTLIDSIYLVREEYNWSN